jgi:flavodoxin
MEYKDFYKGDFNMSYGKVLVVYYSRSGKTKKAAEALAKKYNAVSEEIIEKVNRKGILGWIKSGRDALKEKTTDIEPSKNDPGKYDLVIIGCPVWASKVTPAVRTYLNLYKNSLKNVAFFCTEGSSGGDKVMEDMSQICGLKPQFTYEFTNKDIRSKNYIEIINKK